MLEILQQLTAIPGVVGSLACGPDGEILASDFPPVFEESSLRRVAALLADEAGALRNVVDAAGSLDLRYTGGRAIVKRMPSGAMLLVCTSTINPQLLNLSMTQCWRRLEKYGLPPPPATSAPAGWGPEWEAVRERFLQALVQQIGPIGDMVLAQAWAAWVAAAPPAQARLPKLAAALAQEIDEGEARAQFLARARAITS